MKPSEEFLARPMKTRTQRDLDLELIESIDVDTGLSEWEADFVSDLIGRLRGNAALTLTPKQREVAERIQRRLDT